MTRFSIDGPIFGANENREVDELHQAFPPLLLAIAIMAFLDQGLDNLILALVMRRWISYCRVARGQALSLRSREFVEAARLSAIKINRTKVTAYVMCGLCAGVGSLILTSRVASAQPTLGTSLPLASVAAVVLGGVSLFGGRGSVISVAFGGAFVSILANGLNLLNVSSYT